MVFMEGQQIEFLRKLGCGKDTTVRVLHVIEPLSWELQTGYPATMVLSDTIVNEFRRSSELLITDIQEKVREICKPKYIDTQIRDGNVANEIIAAADEFEADLILVGSHGKSGIARFLLGSVSQTISTHSKRSVLIARLSEAKNDIDKQVAAVRSKTKTA